jgi:hypothetical protein
MCGCRYTTRPAQATIRHPRMIPTAIACFVVQRAQYLAVAGCRPVSWRAVAATFNQERLIAGARTDQCGDLDR